MGDARDAFQRAGRLHAVREMRERLLEFFYNDDEFQRLIRWARHQPVLNAVEIDIARKLTHASSPLRVIEDHCRASAESLAQSSVVLCVYGSVNVGKSTFCNLLLGRPTLHVTNVQCTAVTTAVHSAESVAKIKVIFEPEVNIP